MDRKSYQKTFDQVHLSARRADQIRSELTARCAGKEMEDTMAHNKKNRRPMAAVLAVCAVTVLTVTAFASGGLGHVIRLMTSPDVSFTTTEDLAKLPGGVQVTVDGAAAGDENLVSPVELREDGRVYLTINGENQDITDRLSYETPYIYDCDGEDGLRHYFIIGGQGEDIGWVEYACDDGGDVVVSGISVSVPEDAEPMTLPWLKRGLEQTMGGSMDIQPSEDGSGDDIQIFHFEYKGEDVTGYVRNDEAITLTENEG